MPGDPAPFGEFAAATKILDELYGLRIEPLPQRGPWVPMGVEFPVWESFAPEDQEEISQLSELLKVRICVIGIVGRSAAYLLLADTGHLFELGIAAPGVFLDGTNFGDGLRRILTGAFGIPLEFSEQQDPEGTFRWVDRPDVSPDVAVRPSVETGIREAVVQFPDER